MQEVDLMDFYNLGREMRALTIRETKPLNQLSRLTGKHLILRRFLDRTEEIPFPATRTAMVALADHLNAVMNEIANRQDIDVFDRDTVDYAEAKTKRLIEEFERAFDRDTSRAMYVFAVTPKDDRDLRVLISDAIQHWSSDLLVVLPDKTKDDLREAGRCLAFERPTACAFHVCRATEALMLAYYEKLAGHPWPYPQRDWGNYNNQLTALHAPTRITTRLDEIRKLDRNAYAHPDLTVPVDEAPIIYGLCRNVIFLMAKEMI